MLPDGPGWPSAGMPTPFQTLKKTLTHGKQMIPHQLKQKVPSFTSGPEKPQCTPGKWKDTPGKHIGGQGVGVQGPLRMGESQHVYPWPPSHYPSHLTGLILGPGPYFAIFTEAASVKIQRDHLHFNPRDQEIKSETNQEWA